MSDANYKMHACYIWGFREKGEKKMKKQALLTIPLVLVLALSVLLGQPVFGPAGTSPISGAIFTTDETGLLVDGNIYANALDVYLSGGPGPNAPPTAAGLPDGEYYFQVTNPPGKKLLSTDDIEERRFRVEGGVITEYLGTTHIWNDISSEIPNAIVIQLWPFGKTPNKGGVYKAWATPVDKYDETDPHSFWGFIPRYSKTDNYKVRKERPITRLILDKFYDADNSGFYDNDDYLIVGWAIDVTDPLGVTNTYYTPEVIDVTGNPGTYTITEDLPAGWKQTAVAIDSTYMPVSVTVTVEIVNGESHDVLYGNTLPPPPPPPPVGISLYINPVSVLVGNPVTFEWSITSPPEVTPDYAELYLKAPDGTTIPLATYTVFPPWTGSYVWTSTTPTGLWRVYMDYHYKYLGTDYLVRAYGSFNVHT